MTTLEAPSVTPCPVPWCPDNGHHVWTHDDLTTERRHSMRVLVTPTGFGRDIVVTAEVYETPAGTEPLVDLDNADQLSSRAQVERVIAAMREAADLAFGRVEGLNNPETPAELAVLHAVQEMAAGRVGQNAVIEAWERLTVARATEAVDIMDEFDVEEATR